MRSCMGEDESLVVKSGSFNQLIMVQMSSQRKYRLKTKHQRKNKKKCYINSTVYKYVALCLGEEPHHP